MSRQSFRTPRIRDIIIGIVAFMILLTVIRTVPSWIKVVGTPFLYIPSRLGLIKMVAHEDVHTYRLTAPSGQFDFAKRGRYAVFTDDYDLLLINDALIETDAAPWLTVRSQATGVPMPVSFVKRGMLPFDTPFARGRPILTIEISRPGTYLLTHPGKGAVISFVPDYTTGKEGVIVAAYIIQLAIILVPIGVIFYPRYLARRARQKAAREQKRREGDQFWQTELRRQHRTRNDER